MRFRLSRLRAITRNAVQILFGVAGFACVLSAQNAGTVGGTVTDPSGAVVRAATIELKNERTAEIHTTRTSDQGAYLFPYVMPGVYTLAAEATGFKRLEQARTTVDTIQKVTVDLHLQLGSETQTVNVESSAVEINRTDATVGAVVGNDLVQNIPLNGRSLQSLLTLVPGVVPIQNPNNGAEFSVAGQRAQSNIFSIDGVSANISAGADGASGNMAGLNAVGGTQSLVSIDELQEFRVNTSVYSAEYGTSPGGQFLLTTRSGGNDFHGTAYEYLRNEDFDANDWFNNLYGYPRGTLRQNQFGGTLGGPVVIPHLYDGHNRTFFFASYEQLKLTTPLTQVLETPDQSLRSSAASYLQPFLNALPAANGPALGDGFGEYRQQLAQPNNIYTGALRLDQMIGTRGRAFFRFNKSPSDSTAEAGRWYNSATETSLTTATAGLTWMFGPRVLNDFRLNYSSNRNASLEVPTVPVDLFSYLNRTPGPSDNWSSLLALESDTGAVVIESGRTSATQRQLEYVDTFAWHLGGHDLKFGIDIRSLTPTISPTTFLSALEFFSVDAINSGIPDYFVIGSNIQAHPTFHNYAAFATDTWKVSPRLTVSLGLRWEADPLPGSTDGLYPYVVRGLPDLMNLSVAPEGTPLYKTTYANFAPRAGIAYALSTVPGWETVLRLGSGIFYDTNNNLVADAYSGAPYGASNNLSGSTYPFTEAELTPPDPIRSFTPPIRGYLNYFDPHLKLPVTYSWSAALEQALGKKSSVSLTYVGNGGRRLLENFLLENVSSLNEDYPNINMVTNGPTSSYNALQIQYTGRPHAGAEIFGAYTWSHSIDNTAIDQANNLPLLIKGNSDADLTQVFRLGLSYEVPRMGRSRLVSALVNGWGTDMNIAVQCGYPFSIQASFLYLNDGSAIPQQPNLVTGIPLWAASKNAPGGTRVNPLAFSAPPAGVNGNFGRNVLRGFSVGQADIAVRRTFHPLEKLGLQFRAEAFNITNHPNFSSFNNRVTSSTFGQAQSSLSGTLTAYGSPLIYQIGGPRTLQFAAKIMF